MTDAHVPLSGGARFRFALLALAAATLLLVAARLEANPEGLGTHKQMGLPTCSWVADASGPCPTCGMTTAFALAADGRLFASFSTQPAAAVGALLAAMAVWLGGFAAVTGALAVRKLRGLLTWRLFAIVALGMLAAWAWTRYRHG